MAKIWSVAIYKLIGENQVKNINMSRFALSPQLDHYACKMQTAAVNANRREFLFFKKRQK